MLWLNAALLIAAALGFVLVPVWRLHRKAGTWSRPGLAAAALLVPVTIGLYFHVTTWSPQDADQQMLPAVDEMVSELASRLEQNPDDVNGWRLLGQTYVALGRYPEARDALRQAWQRTPEPDAELRLALGEAEALNDREALLGEAGALFESVLAEHPDNPKALWYGGLSALMAGDSARARARWSKLLELDPPEAVAQVLRDQLERLGGPGMAAQTPLPQTATADTGAAIHLSIRLAEALAARPLAPGAALFIFARSPQGGPPLAVIRESAAVLPGEFSLSDDDAMLPGRSLGDFETLSIVARLSPSGQPTAQAGDLFGEIDVRPGADDGTVELVIDQIVP
jgi:cytochrome c-type biogenesis protein CcmH